MKKLAILFLVFCSTFALGTDLCPAGYWTWQRFADVSGINHDRICVKYTDASLLFLPAGSTSPADPDTSVQFNDGGLFGGDAGLVWNKTSKNLHVFGIDSSATALQAETYGTAAQTSSSPGLTVGAQYDGSADLLRVRGMYAVAGKDTSDTSTVTNAEAIFIDSIYANHGTITNAVGLNINGQTAGTHNYGIKIDDIGNGAASDFAIQSGNGNVNFNDAVLYDDVNSFFNVALGYDVYFGDASTNSCTVVHTHFYNGNTYPGMLMCATTGNIPVIDLYGDSHNALRHTEFTSDTIVSTNNIGAFNVRTVTNPTGNSIGEQIFVTGGVGGDGKTALALELRGAGDGYEGSIAIQTDSGGRAIMSGGVQLFTGAGSPSGSQPTCNSNIRGTMWATRGSAGVADTIQVCMKDTLNAYAWHTVTIP